MIVYMGCCYLIIELDPLIEPLMGAYCGISLYYFSHSQFHFGPKIHPLA